MSIKYASIVPLIGGTTIALKNVLKSNPEYILSYDAFKNNDLHLINFLDKNIPYYSLEEKIPKLKKVDIISTVCPCAGLSSLNVNSSSTSSSNEWMYKTANFVLETLKPKVFFGENAPSLISNKGILVRQKLLEIAKKHNYSFSIIKTDTLLHNVPQKRVRTFYFFWKSKYSPFINFTDKTKADNLTEFLKKIPKSSSYQDVFLTNTKLIETPSYLFLREYFKIDHKELVNLTNHKSLLNYIIHNNLASKFRKFLVKNKYDKDLRILDHCISKNEDGKNFWDNSPNSHVERTCAITGRSYVNIIHPTDERVLNFRELMTLMGLPFDFQLIKRQKGGIPYNHICQNVPVNTAQYFVEQIVKFINNELEFSENNYLLQDNTNCNNWYENF